MALVRLNRRPAPSVFPALTAFSGIPGFGDVENRISRFLENGPFGAVDTGLITPTLGWVPAMEITESDTELSLTAELPGMDQKNVDVSIDDGVLTIRGEKTEERKEGDESKKFYLAERSYGSFERSFTLPRTVDAGAISAKFTNGILVVHMPKAINAKPKGRKIDIAGA